MLLAIGIVIVFASCVGGFMMAGGNPMSLVHAGEIIIICGIGLGIVVVSSPKSVLVGLSADITKAFKGGVSNKGKFIDLGKGSEMTPKANNCVRQNLADSPFGQAKDLRNFSQLHFFVIV